MKKHQSSLFIIAVCAAVYFGLAMSAQAVPPPPPAASVPDGGSTGLLLGAALGGLGFLKWKFFK